MQVKLHLFAGFRMFTVNIKNISQLANVPDWETNITMEKYQCEFGMLAKIAVILLPQSFAIEFNR
jgi:hypothetical protein